MKAIIILCILITVEAGKRTASLGERSEKFSADIFKNYANGTENQLISPISIQTIMALLQSGSDGICLDELSKVLHLPKKTQTLKNIFQNYHNQTKYAKIDITSANNMYITEKFKLPKYYKKLENIFNSSIREINSATPKTSINQINQWVEDQTHKKIKNIVDETIINADTILILINALYFNAHWMYPFDEEMTHKKKFHTNNESIYTKMMLQEGYFNYTTSDVINAKILELPYEDENYVMNIILPNEKNGINEVAGKFDQILQILNSLQEEELHVLLPKFEFGAQNDLNDVLQNLGLKSIFNQMQFKEESIKNVRVSKIVQKTCIDVNEKGAEGSVATTIGLEDKIGGYEKTYFVADHPFLFIIRHKISRVILFIGIYRKP